MTWAHVHLAVNHFPIIGTILGALVLGYGWAIRSRSVERVGFSLLTLSALLSIAAFVSGGRAEEVAEHWPGVAESWIEDHEEAAKLAFFATLAAGAAAAVTLFLSRAQRAVPMWGRLLTLTIGAVAILLLMNAANLGGRIRHPELRPSDAPGAPEREPTGAVPVPSRIA